MGKVDEMKAQRSMLAERFRAEVMEDDITKKLVGHKDKAIDEVFEIELKKHEATRKLIRQNLAAQRNILQAGIFFVHFSGYLRRAEVRFFELGNFQTELDQRLR